LETSALKSKFGELFGSSPLLIRSPGRINLIGEHTDYNEGFVLPAAIDKEIVLALAKNGTDTCRIFSQDYGEMESFSLSGLTPKPNSWSNYIKGVAAQLMEAGHLISGFDGVFGGNIPIGAGLSSSAALENGVCFGLSELFGLNLDPLTMIKFSQRAEHEFAGVACGIMDQFASMMGKTGHSIRLDCRSLAYDYIPLNLDQYRFVLCDSRVKHSLVDTEYNIRKMECEIGVKTIRQYFDQVVSLRDVSPEMLEKVKPELPSKVYSRCLYVLQENRRVLEACSLLEAGDLPEFGKLMYGSHVGLSKLYEVSCPELDFLVKFTQDQPEVLGARMMGGGFGGCTINLVQNQHVETFKTSIVAAYLEQFGQAPEIYEVRIVGGTSPMDGEN